MGRMIPSWGAMGGEFCTVQPAMGQAGQDVSVPPNAKKLKKDARKIKWEGDGKRRVRVREV